MTKYDDLTRPRQELVITTHVLVPKQVDQIKLSVNIGCSHARNPKGVCVVCGDKT